MKVLLLRFILKPYLAGFIRDREEGDPLNNALNYGYSIVRALMARALAAKGLLLSIGIKHHNI